MRYLSGKSILLALIGFILLFLILSAARTGVADLLSRYARNEIDTWSVSAPAPKESALESLSNVLGVARFISPGNPDHLEDLARISLLYARLPQVSSAERDLQLAQGLAYIRSAIALRPVSSYSWASLLLLKREQGVYDEEFRHALARSVILGPWEPDVVPVVADVGLSAWAALPIPEQEMVRENFVRGMKRQSEAMIAIAQAHQNSCTGEQTGCSK